MVGALAAGSAARQLTARHFAYSVNAQVECLLREAVAARGVKLKAPAPRKRGRPPKETNE
ncbi:MAG: toxin-antitoxin system HicB family antitoxin [Sphingomicrobium sp.]